MLVEIGNDRAIEILPSGEVRRLPGERVTHVIVPEGVSPDGAVQLVCSLMPLHMDMRPLDDGALPSPAWVDCFDKDVRRGLCENLGIDPKKNKRPTTWGIQ